MFASVFGGQWLLQASLLPVSKFEFVAPLPVENTFRSLPIGKSKCITFFVVAGRVHG